MNKFLVAQKDERGAWQKVDIARHMPGAGVACVVPEGTAGRAEIDGAISFLLAEKAAVDVLTISGYRVSRL